MNYIFDYNKTFYDNFFNLLSNTKKDDFFGGISDDDFDDFGDDYEQVLDILGIDIDNAIHEYLHYQLDIYLEITKDELGNTIPLLLGVGKRFNEMFSGVVIKLEDNGYCSTKYVIENEELNEGDDYYQEERLKQFIGTEYFNDIFILISDLLLYDDNVETYVAMSKEFEENFSDKLIYIPIDSYDYSVYVNSTLMKEDILINENIN